MKKFVNYTFFKTFRVRDHVWGQANGVISIEKKNYLSKRDFSECYGDLQ